MGDREWEPRVSVPRGAIIRQSKQLSEAVPGFRGARTQRPRYDKCG